MKMLSEPKRAAPIDCPYLPDRLFVQDYFFATDLDHHEFGVLLATGWRRFGSFFFRPSCPGCRRCIPLRIDVRKLEPTRSQRRVLSRGREIRMEAVPPAPSDEAWRVYEAHSAGQFDHKADREGFNKTFFEKAVPALQTEYRLEGELIGLGFLDVAHEGMSSVYFAFDPRWSRYSPGVLSVLREAELAQRKGLRWYYLGYWISGCSSMDYKARFAPHQLYNWELKTWMDSADYPAFSPTE